MLPGIDHLKLWTCFLTLVVIAACQPSSDPAILVFSKTAGFRHESIESGIEALKKIGAEHSYRVEATEDASVFNDESLAGFNAVVFLNTTGDILNKQQQNDFERFIQAGGGFVGIHAATDTEYSWPWYNGLVGAYFTSHPNNPNVRTADFDAIDHNHPAMDSFPDRFSMTDEFYNFRSIKRDDINVLIKIDETSYEGGENDNDHPMSWYHEYDGGRSFYTALGHTNEMFEHPLFVKHLEGAIFYVLGGENPSPLDYDAVKTPRVPEENRFNIVSLAEGLDEPVELAVLPDERVLFVERKGAVKLYDPESDETKTIHTIEVSQRYKFKDNGRDEAEDGLLGLALDPDFSDNGWVYMYYSQPGDKPVNILTRWTLNGDELDVASEKKILEVDVQREQCCHTGGSIAFDAHGNLFLSTGDNTSPRGTAYAPIDERPDRFPWDAQKGSSNTNDLRGKVLRITPQDDGTYTIPEGNLFPPGTEKTRPEIYGMGMRNPYRISVDQKTGYVYWGDVGPDARESQEGQGPAGHDEVNQMRKPGFFGWPYFVGDNQAYHDVDFATGHSGPKFDPELPVNQSPNNTGLESLPPAQPAFIYYTYGASDKFPSLGTGGRTAMAGPVYYHDDFKNSARPYPEYFDGQLFIYEWMRGWIQLVSMDENGDFVEMSRFLPSHKFSNPMDMEFGPNGDLYVLEYGSGWFQKNDDARLVRIEYNGGNRKPVIKMEADKPKGAIPHTVAFSSEGTIDYDQNTMKYEWSVKNNEGEVIQTFNEPNPKFTFEDIGAYDISLKVTDSQGESSEASMEIVAGNEPPVVNLDLVNSNSSFFFPDVPFDYKVTVSDKEDGAVPEEAVSLTIDFLKEGFDQIEIAQGHVAADENVRFAVGEKMIGESDCFACHKINEESIGPKYVDIAKKYKDQSDGKEYLITKIIEGGSGVWGTVAMAAHPTLERSDVAQMVDYILSLDNQSVIERLPLEGSYVINSEDVNPGQGAVIIRATYEDQGANGVAPARTTRFLQLEYPAVDGGLVVDEVDINRLKFNNVTILTGQKDGSMISFADIDLTQVASLDFRAVASNFMNAQGGYIEVRIDTPEGKLIGKSEAIKPIQGFGGPGAAPVSVPIEATNGSHKIYVFYRNDDPQEGTLFTITGFSLTGAKKQAI